MSYKVTEYVLSRMDLTPTEKAVAHSLAYRAHEDGSESYPGIQTIAREAGLKDLRFTRRVIRRLEEKGVIEATTPKRGGRNERGRGLTTHYRFLLDNPGLYTPADAPATLVSNHKKPGLYTPVNPGLLSPKPGSIDPPNCPEPSIERLEKEKNVPGPSLTIKTTEGRQGKSPENGQREAIASEFFVWLRRRYDRLTLSAKHRATVAAFIAFSTADLRTLQRAAEGILTGLNLGDPYVHADNRLAANLADAVEAIIRDHAQHKADQEVIARKRAEIEAEAERERAARRAEEPEEIEETLGECQSPEPILLDTAG